MTSLRQPCRTVTGLSLGIVAGTRMPGPHVHVQERIVAIVLNIAPSSRHVCSAMNIHRRKNLPVGLFGRSNASCSGFEVLYRKHVLNSRPIVVLPVLLL